MNKLLPLLSLIILVSCNLTNKNSENSISIAFGSCSRQEISRQMWPEIMADNPDLFVWSGDIIYADGQPLDAMRMAYQTQKNHPDYKRLLTEVPIIGVWDDHDFGANDGGKNFSKKAESQRLLLDFLDVPATDPRRKREGVYFAHTIKQANKNIKIILLDTRYFRDTLATDTVTSARYLPSKTGDILGEAQWKWLENELTDSTFDLNILVSSIQVLPEEHNYEKWANFPTARKRLFNLISKTVPKNLLLISGDRHIAEISKIDIEGYPKPIYELTASGLTHSWETLQEEPNKYRVGKLITEKNYGLVNILHNNDHLEVAILVKGHNGEIFLKQNITF